MFRDLKARNKVGMKDFKVEKWWDHEFQWAIKELTKFRSSLTFFKVLRDLINQQAT